MERPPPSPVRASPSPLPGAPTGAPDPARAELLALARAGRPFEFVPRATAALALGRAREDDDRLRVLLAATYTRLGLRTPAREALDAIGVVAAADPSVPQLAALIEALPSDGVDPGELVDRLRRNLAALAGRASGASWGVVDAPGLDAAALAWEAELASPRGRARQWLRTSAGVVVRRRAGSGVWERFVDDAAAAAAVGSALPSPAGAGDRPMPPAFVVEGLGLPAVLAELAGRTPAAADGRQTPIWVVEPSLEQAIEALALADLSGVLSQARVGVFIGPGAVERLASRWRRDLGLRLSAAVVPAPAPLGAEAALARVLAEQAAAGADAGRRAAAVYAGRDRVWWGHRYRAAATGRASGPVADTSPLRVLVPTCRYSTFVRHSSADIAAAARAAGMEARVLIEPDDASQFTPLATLAEVASFAPDLVVLINWPRSLLGGAVPAGVPMVCWVQDPMPHLFDRATGAAQGPLDFLAGHVHAAMFEEFAWPRGRAVACPVLVSRAKFHAGSVDPGLAERMTCDIACATHHSQTPEQLRDELIDRARGSGDVPEGGLMARAVAALYEEVVARARAPHGSWSQTALNPPVERVIADLGLADRDKAFATLFHSVARPLADRAVRHQALGWAAEIARDRGLRLHIYGRGWERHPTLAPFARGTLDHGEELRAAYACAGVHLHASAGASLHQRAMECFLSGGLCLFRTKLYDLEAIEAHAAARAVLTGPPDEPGFLWRAGDGPDAPTYPGARYDHARHPATLAYAMLRTRMGFPLDRRLYLHDRQVAEPWGYAGGVPVEHEAANVWGDLWELAFDTRQRLADRLDRALSDPQWRASITAGVRGRVERHYTYEGVVPAMVSRVGEMLAGK